MRDFRNWVARVPVFCRCFHRHDRRGSLSFCVILNRIPLGCQAMAGRDDCRRSGIAVGQWIRPREDIGHSDLPNFDAVKRLCQKEISMSSRESGDRSTLLGRPKKRRSHYCKSAHLACKSVRARAATSCVSRNQSRTRSMRAAVTAHRAAKHGPTSRSGSELSVWGRRRAREIRTRKTTLTIQLPTPTNKQSATYVDRNRSPTLLGTRVQFPPPPL
jgi:hypothetical protein